MPAVPSSQSATTTAPVRNIATAIDPTKHRLLAEVTCPNCWHVFAPELILFIARHDELIGDDIAGETAYRRFRPTRFDAHGDALDARGLACQDLACPHCHLSIARPLIELPPLFTSIVGVPSSGKSYFLATMTWELRRLAAQFGFVMTDGDPINNAELQQSEETLFMPQDPNQAISLRKTEVTGDALYQTVFFEGQRQSFPRPFVFSVTPSRGHEHPLFPYRSLVLYDNAGEHFLPGQDATNSPVTHHLAESSSIVFLFDPTQDTRFRKHCKTDDPQLDPRFNPTEQKGSTSQTGQTTEANPPITATNRHTNRQEVILSEVASRVRRYRGLSQTQRHQKPLILLLAKADVWLNDPRFDEEPITQTQDGKTALDLNTIQAVSHNCRKLLLETCPEVVNTAEDFAEQVLYLPASSLGSSPEVIEQAGSSFLGVRPANIKPKWVTVPMLWTLAMSNKGLIETIYTEPT